MMRVMGEACLPSAEQRAEFKKLAIEAARRAGDILTGYARHGFVTELKEPINLVTDADRASEQAIVDYVSGAYPEHQILAEERGFERDTESPYRWVVDPLDGTKNFAHGLPVYCVSIGLEYDGRIILGVVWDPPRQELFVAEVGGGATCNDQPIGVSSVTGLNNALLVTGFAYDVRDTVQNNLEYFARFTRASQGVRRLGSAALDLCYVASGRLDGFWEMKLNPWDTAAGVLILEEAGGRITDFAGGPFSIYGKEMLASNGHVHEDMLRVLANS